MDKIRIIPNTIPDMESDNKHSITISFLIVGHTKFAPDGLLKRVQGIDISSLAANRLYFQSTFVLVIISNIL